MQLAIGKKQLAKKSVGKVQLAISKTSSQIKD
jgi:hypothetical protein